MRIVIHDFAGHQFQTQLSSELSARGHTVVHMYFAEDPGPKGSFDESNASGVRFLPVSIGVPYSKSGLLRRLFLDLKYRRKVAKVLSDIEFDILVSSNCPTWVQGAFLKASRRRPESRFFYWCQDFYGIAVGSILRRKLGFVAHLLEKILVTWDLAQMRASDGVIHITDDFRRITERGGVPSRKTHIIHNWGSLADISPEGKSNAWAQMNLADASKRRVVYAGTLGLKHNPNLLVDAARLIPDVEFLVVAAGVGVDRLRLAEVPNLVVKPLQPLKALSSVLGSSDVLVAIIENDAGKFSVPSKILSYLCAAKPIVLSAPKDNLAAVTVLRAGAGVVTDSDNSVQFASAIAKMLSNPEQMVKMGASARQYAESEFCILEITDRFEKIFSAS